MPAMAETLSFKAEVQELLDLMVHSLYSHREIFLRELISNASDALDKRRVEGLKRPELAEDWGEPAITIEVDADQRRLSVRDNGIGMSREEIIEDLGTIARSGTRQFLSELRQAEAVDRPQLIGQFGVGFYSSFMVAEEISVESRRAGEAEGVCWRSQGGGRFTVDEAGELPVGTCVSLKLKAPAEEEGETGQDFTSPYVLRALVKKYSDFVEYPIQMRAALFETPSEDREVDPEELSVLNSRKPLWARPKDEVSAEEYLEFYRHVAHHWKEPLETIHFHAEGASEYAALLYVPAERPFDLYEPSREKSRVSLYVKRVFVMADCEDLMPPWLRFVCGVVDAEDLPLNVSREILQQNRMVAQIRKRCSRKVLDALGSMLAEDRARYSVFWGAFGVVLKEGIVLDADHSEAVADVSLFESTREGGPWTLKEYVERMDEGQEEIWYLTGEDPGKLGSSPHLEALAARGFEVLLLSDPVDEWVVQRLPEYQGKKLRPVDRGAVELDSEEDRSERQERQKELESLLAALEAGLVDEVQAVRFSSRLTDSAAVLVTDEASPGPHMERLMRQAGQEVPAPKRILELNPDHELIGKLKAIYDEDVGSPRLKDFGQLLYGQALLTEGSPLPEPARFARLVTELMVKAT